MALYGYMEQVQNFIRDKQQQYINPADLQKYVNRARREVAMRTQSVRVLSPVSGSIKSITITNPGAGYVNPIATITPPDFPNGEAAYPAGAQATATCQQIGGVITQIDVTFGGSGYFQPQITIKDGPNGLGPGVGATATLNLTPMWQTNNNQEIYSFSQVPLSNFPGVGSVYWVNSVSIIYAAFRFSCMVYSFSTYQALIRNYPRQYLYVPAVMGQLGQGTNGTLYLYPIASQSYQMEWDCLCLPLDLHSDEDFEAIPGPWTDLVPYYAAHLAFLELQNLNAAAFYKKLYVENMNEFSTFARPGRVSNRYGRW